MSKRGRVIWLVHGSLALCAVLLLGAMAALTRGAVNTERKRAQMEAKADEQERTRLALWRMDAAAAAWIADEAQRPVLDSTAKEAAKSEIKLRFDAREDGVLLADDPDRIPVLRQVLGLPPGGIVFPMLCAGIPEIPSAWMNGQPDADVQMDSKANARQSTEYQKLANTKELAGRGRAVKGALDSSQVQFNNLNNGFNSEVGNWNLLRGSLPRPARLGAELFLLRHLQWKRPNGSTMRSIQGAWLDEPALKAMLLKEVVDLFPSASLIAANPADTDEGLGLASFPWKLSPATDSAEIPLPDGVAFPLIAGWLAAVIAIVATWLLVAGLLRLSERRASFVSAVTHELRTPLTTFQLYSEMLESGAIKEDKRGHYFMTLRREAERLSHLVENVLAFSRIERRCPGATTGSYVAGELIGPMLERFRGRLSEAGMSLEADIDAPAWKSAVKADSAAVEHVLFNLIDNASKYAAGSSPAVVHLEAEPVKRGVKIRVRDHGKGVPPKERKRIFQAFHKSAAAAAESRPGVGLGLSLSRRLARAGGGDLQIEDGGGGASFALTLPAC